MNELWEGFEEVVANGDVEFYKWVSPTSASAVDTLLATGTI